MDITDIDIVRLHKNARLPEKKNLTDAGADLYTVEDTLLKAYDTALVRTGIAVSIPIGMEMQIRPRSGFSINGIEGTKELPVVDNDGNLACKTYRFKMAQVQLGTIDSGYRQEVNIIVVNFGSENLFIPAGTRLAQAVISSHVNYRWNVVEKLDKTGDRGGGLGHTGVR